MLSALILSEHSYPALGLAAQQEHQRSVQPNPVVLRLDSLKTPPPTVGRDQPGSRRSEPSSRTALIGEQPNPWDRLQPQEAMGRHRGAKRSRRYGRSVIISQTISWHTGTKKKTGIIRKFSPSDLHRREKGCT